MQEVTGDWEQQLSLLFYSDLSQALAGGKLVYVQLSWLSAGSAF